MFQYSLEVSRSTSIVSEPIYIDLSSTDGSSAVFPCDVDMDQILRGGQQGGQDYPDIIGFAQPKNSVYLVKSMGSFYREIDFTKERQNVFVFGDFWDIALVHHQILMDALSERRKKLNLFTSI